MKKLLLISATLALGLSSMSSCAGDGFFSSFFPLKRHNEVATVVDKDYIEDVWLMPFRLSTWTSARRLMAKTNEC